MYVFSHVPWVFGQPFIAEVLAQGRYTTNPNVVSGAIVCSMMLISVAAGWVAEGLEQRIGTPAILMLSLGMQIMLIAILMASVEPIALAFLLFRMVPGAFSRPFILAGVQPRIDSDLRATFLSLQSLCGRVLLAVTLLVVAFDAPTEGTLPAAALQQILLFYVVAGCAVFAALLIRIRALDGRD